MMSTGMEENPKKKFVVSFDTNTLDEAQLDAFGGISLTMTFDLMSLLSGLRLFMSVSQHTSCIAL